MYSARLISLILLTLFLSTLPNARAGAACVPALAAREVGEQPPLSPEKAALFETQRANLPEQADILLLGDSHARNLPLAMLSRAFPTLSAYKFAIGGDTIPRLLYRLDHTRFGTLRPAVLLLSIGSNDIAGGVPACAVAAGLDHVLAYLRRQWPDSRLVLLEPPPRGLSLDRNEDERRAYADILRALAAGRPSIHFLALPPAVTACQASLRRDARPDPSPPHCPAMAADDTHLSPLGYTQWIAALQPVVDGTAPTGE